jgi:hypothetical protein
LVSVPPTKAVALFYCYHDQAIPFPVYFFADVLDLYPYFVMNYRSNVDYSAVVDPENVSCDAEVLDVKTEFPTTVPSFQVSFPCDFFAAGTA